MAKRIIVCLDGTNNEPGKAETNVQRLFKMAAQVPQEQIAYYQPGIGTLSPSGVYLRARQRILQFIDSASAWMIQRHVTSAYRFLMDAYETGDQLYVFGFSRGAYTARVFCGMLETVGLLRQGMVEMIPFAWDEYRRIQPSRRGADRTAQFCHASRFKKHFARPVELSFLGLWDTVSSVGTPWQPRVFPRTSANKGVRVVRHALALDERRAMFLQNLWRGNPKQKQDVKQVWFAGVHADVGGGYPLKDAGLALVTLAWMVRESQMYGMTFDPQEREKILPEPNLDIMAMQFAHAPIHESLINGWRLLEYFPMPRWEQREDDTWECRWRVHRGASRRVPPGSLVHRSVCLRCAAEVGYEPVNLPSKINPVF